MERRALAVGVGLLTVVGTCFATFVANVWRWVECCSESGLQASPAGERQLVVAALGLIPALGTLVSSLRTRGHPWNWFCATVLVYAVWGVLIVVWIT
jgi:hypothetical protein